MRNNQQGTPLSGDASETTSETKLSLEDIVQSYVNGASYRVPSRITLLLVLARQIGGLRLEEQFDGIGHVNLQSKFYVARSLGNTWEASVIRIYWA